MLSGTVRVHGCSRGSQIIFISLTHPLNVPMHTSPPCHAQAQPVTSLVPFPAFYIHRHEFCLESNGCLLNGRMLPSLEKASPIPRVLMSLLVPSSTSFLWSTKLCSLLIASRFFDCHCTRAPLPVPADCLGQSAHEFTPSAIKNPDVLIFCSKYLGSQDTCHHIAGNKTY